MLFAAPPDLVNMTPTYKCGTAAAPSVCYATDAKTDALFRNIQAEANKFAGKYGFAPIGVDGKIGPSTVNALKTIGQRLIADPLLAGVGVSIFPKVVSKESIAQNAQAIYKALADTSTRLALPPVAAPSTSPTVPTAPGPTIPLPSPPARSKTWTYVGVAAIVAGVLGVGYYAMRQRAAV